MAGENFDRYKTILDKARNEKLEVLNTWYSLFKLNEDPFAREIPDEEIDSYFIDRENIIENIIFDIGVASRGIPIIVLLVAPTGFGKSSLLRYIHHIITKIVASTDTEKYSFKGEYMLAESLFDTKDGGGGEDSNDDDDNNKDSVQSWIKISKRIRDFILFDDANPNYIRTIINEFINTKLKLFAISPIDLEQALSIIQYEPKIYFLSEFNYNDCVRMLEQRLKMTIQTENKNNIKIYDLFDETAIKTIYDNSFGIPKLILECSSKALSLLKSIVIGKTSKSEQQRQIDNNNNNKKVTSQIAIQACRQIKCEQAKKEYENLSNVRKEIIDKIIFKTRSATDIAAEIRKDRTTVSRYLNELKDLDLITFNTHGRETLYKATLPTQILYEMKLMPSIENGEVRVEAEKERGGREGEERGGRYVQA